MFWKEADNSGIPMQPKNVEIQRQMQYNNLYKPKIKQCDCNLRGVWELNTAAV